MRRKNNKIREAKKKEEKSGATYPALLGLDGAMQTLNQLMQQAKSNLDLISSTHTKHLWEIAQYIIKRTY
ncbi:hypothetical protein [Facilibium subflavum]|uniref:hypothetical protein n=1 Tax=Facilibium subflavum TaxID=2219058 RepID=UPI000E646D89|nr:hypothetical protein [Facilibium subflavum]